MRAQANAATHKLDGGSSGVFEAYDPMKLYARVLYHYRGAITDADFAHMDYRRFFGYVRELDYILSERAEAGGNKPKKQNEGEIHAALNQFPQPELYTGETIQLI